MKILLISVGGSDIPVVTSIKSIRPDKVIFFCTGDKLGSRVTVDGDGLVCGDFQDGKRVNTRPNIVVQTQLNPSQVYVEEVEADNPFDTYDKALKRMEDFPGEDFIIDYTGGTKSMSAGLWGASTEVSNCSLVIVKGPRINLEKVRGEHSRVQRFERNVILGKRLLQSAKTLLSDRKYDSAYVLLHDMLSLEGVSENEKLDQIRYLVSVYRDWDRFEYEAALETMEVYCKLYRPDRDLVQYKMTLERLVDAKEMYVQFKQQSYSSKRIANGFVLINDLLMNASRKAAERCYDDAVSRLYRAAEMYAQFALLRCQVITADVNLDELPGLPAERKAYYEEKRNEKGKIQIGMKDGYDLLQDLGQPVGEVWERWKKKIIQVLQLRNYSFLAHGMNPIKEHEYLECKEAIWSFISECDALDAALSKAKIGLRFYNDLPNSFMDLEDAN
ncbi:TIGR02710 family CRISPR-associated CARF protein [Paenibacillus chartarius]|uniref:TIGR02710 family CRISPR-associated CARF protein n=1 Tax=Paenibacillus chartarius TaxID=747481 RepID=A0ABV6DTI4_9BACL